MCIKIIKRLLNNLLRRKPAVPEALLAARLPRKWWEFPFRIIRTSHGGFNMPKRQTCPGCGAQAKRKEKTPIGAVYSCKCKTTFLVAAPRRRVLSVPKRRKEPLFITSAAVVRGRTRY